MPNTSAGTVRIEGLTELRRTLRKAGESLSDLKDANTRASQMVAQWAAVRAPVRTGRLSASVRGMRLSTRATVQAGNNTSVRYANPIHWGWRAHNIKANPFISRAAVETQPAWLPAYETEVQKIADSVKGT